MTDDLLLPVHPRTGLRALGVLPSGRPVWPVLGAAETDDDGDTGMDLEGSAGRAPAGRAADTDDDQDDVADDDAGDEWTAPSQEEWAKVQAALKRANDEAAKHRMQVRELRKQTRTPSKPATPASGDGGDAAAEIEAARAAAVEEAERRYKPVAIRAAAAAELVKAGLQNPTDGRIDRLVRRLDMDDIDVDAETGRVGDGLLDQIEDLKLDFPELFTPAAKDGVEKPEPKRRAPRIDGAGRSNQPPPPRNTGERIASQVLGR